MVERADGSSHDPPSLAAVVFDDEGAVIRDGTVPAFTHLTAHTNLDPTPVKGISRPPRRQDLAGALGREGFGATFRVGYALEPHGLGKGERGDGGEQR